MALKRVNAVFIILRQNNLNKQCCLNYMSQYKDFLTVFAVKRFKDLNTKLDHAKLFFLHNILFCPRK